MKVFSKEKFIETMGNKVYELISFNDDFNWIDKFNGKEVKDGYIEMKR